MTDFAMCSDLSLKSSTVYISCLFKNKIDFFFLSYPNVFRRAYNPVLTRNTHFFGSTTLVTAASLQNEPSTSCFGDLL